MRALMIYWIESGIAMIIFYVFYYLFLRKDISFHFNRICLIAALAVSVSAPLFHFSWQVAGGYSAVHAWIPEYWLENVPDNQNMYLTGSQQGWPAPVLILQLYALIAGLLFVRFIFQLKSAIRAIKKNNKIKSGPVTLVCSGQYKSPFSLFNYIFLDRDVIYSDGIKGILQHELTHARQFHTLDRLFVELLCILFWFNPFIYLYRRSITEVHEYIADRSALRNGIDPEYYQYLLLNSACGHRGINLTSMFSNSLTKKRLIMMNLKDSKKSKLITKLLFLPLIAVVVITLGFDFRSDIRFPEPVSLTGINRVFIAEGPGIPSGMPFLDGTEVRIASGYGMRIHPIQKKEMMHYGVDLVAPLGTPVISTAGGIIDKAEFQEGYGNTVLVRHNDEFTTMYTQLQKFIVRPGQKVEKGEVVGYLGESGINTGPHLHYEVHKNGERVNPEDYF